MHELSINYFHKIHRCLENCKVTNNSDPISVGRSFANIIELFKQAHVNGNIVWFVGNGGSSSIASHMAIDYTKNGHIRSMAYNDVAAITCMGNDLGYENIFSQQLEYHIKHGDILVAISSSGKSPNILNAVKMAKQAECKVITFSGFSADNPLRAMGDYNFYTPATEYGLVEISHLALLHCMLDIICGVA